MEEFRDEGNEIAYKITLELQKVHTREGLLSISSKLKTLFTDLAKVMIEAHEFRDKHPEAELPELSLEARFCNDELREELVRIYQIQGGREVIEKCQEEALNQLDGYLQRRTQRRTLRKY